MFPPDNPVEALPTLSAASAGSRLQVRRSTSERRSLFGEIAHAFHEIRESHELVHQLVLRDVRVRYHQALMGFAWALFMPLVIVLAGTLIRIAMATVSGNPLERDLIGATAVKGLVWSFFSGSLQLGTQSLLANRALITKLYFPREVLPLSSVLAQSFDTFIGATAVVVLLPFLGLHLSATLLWVPVIAVLMFLLTLTTVLLTSCANLFFRDVKYIVQVFLTFGIFLTPVFFEPAMLGPTIGPLMMLNPLSPLIEAMRLVVIEGHDLLAPATVTLRSGAEVLAWTPWYLAYSFLWAVGGLVVAMRIFRRSAVIFAEYA